MTEFTPIMSFIGGGLIGLSAVLLMLFHGRIAGLSGMLQAILPPFSKDWSYKAAFLAGSILAPSVIITFSGWRPDFSSETPKLWLIFGGLIVGAGVQLASGCTSGHAVCGIARFSTRSILATLCFMITTALTVYVIRHVIGG